MGITFVFVTHDQEEALTMSDRIAVMSDGEVLQVGTPEEIYEGPNCMFVADFIGDSNFLKGTVTEQTERIAAVQLGNDKIVYAESDIQVAPGTPVHIAIRPEKIDIHRVEGLRNVFTGSVTDTVYIGTDTHYDVKLPTGETLRVDGGMAKNDLFIQLQADVLGIPVTRPVNVETTGIGAAYLAAHGVGIHPTLDSVAEAWTADRTFEPSSSDLLESTFQRFERGVSLVREFARDGVTVYVAPSGNVKL